MKFLKFASRRQVTLVAVAATLLAGTATLAAAAAASAAPSSPAGPAIPRCVSSNTTVWTGFPGDGTAGSIYYEIEISNIGKHTCTLFGYPGVSAVNGNTQVGLPASHSGSKSVVTIPASGTAHFLLRVIDPGAVCAHPVSGNDLKVFAPGQFKAETTPFSVSVCPHNVTLHVDAVHANAGIPNFSNS